ncbi:MAG TPA: HlyD family secretion protein [Dongiaceae bacterium]|nr:HlyD family secretion protein [Dongiaceae bacterium]
MSTEQIESQAAAPTSPADVPAHVAATGARAKSRNPLRRWVAIVLCLIALVFAYSLMADRLTPYTPQGVVQAFVVGIAPEVPGRVSEVNAADNQKTEAGAVLFRVDPEPYQIAVEKAEADVAAAGQSIGANTAGVTAAQARVAETHANLENAVEQTARTLELVKKGVFAKAKGDEAKAQRDAAKAQARQAEAELRQAQESLGPQGADNPQLRAATAVLAKAQRDLVHTAVLAPTDGLVTNLQLTLGQFVPAGQPVMTFIDGRSYWIVASLRENSLEHVQPGAPVEIVFDVLPGQIFTGRVESIGWGVSNSNSGQMGGLPTIKNQTGWIRDPQRFPVRIELDAEGYVPGLRHGSQANVIIYTGDNSIANWLGAAFIRLVSVLTYAT